jgi:hypothetical protein
MEQSKQYLLTNNPTLYINSDTQIPNYYLQVIYTGNTNTIKLPNTTDCSIGQTLTILNKGTGVLIIETDGIDIIKNTNIPILSYNLSSGNSILFISDTENKEWVIANAYSTATENLILNSLSTTNLAGNPINTNINIKNNLLLPAILADPIAIGSNTGLVQSLKSIAIGFEAAKDNQLTAIAIGFDTGMTNQKGIAIGTDAGMTGQEINAIAIGSNSGNTGQQNRAISIGSNSGNNSQKQRAIVIGANAGVNQESNCIAIGLLSGGTDQKTNAIAIGSNAGAVNQGIYAISMGTQAGITNQKDYAIAIGLNTGTNAQGEYSIQIGTSRSNNNCGNYSINIGSVAATNNNQKEYSVSIGCNSGRINQGSNSVIFGNASGVSNVGPNSVILGNGTADGTNSISYSNCVIIGTSSGNTNPKPGAVCIGWNSMKDMAGSNSIGIGRDIGRTSTNPTGDGSIIIQNINSTTNFSSRTNAFFIRQMRSNAAVANVNYNTTTGEISYNSSSDMRIKKDIEIMADEDCSNIVKNLEVKKYNYIDSVIKDKVYGFIAQEVENYIPFAVNKIEKFLPNILQNTTGYVSNGRIKVNFDTKDLAINQEIRLIADTNKIYDCIIETIAPNYFITAKINNLNDMELNLQIYGTKFNDVLSLNKEHLWAVKWGSIRHMIKKIKQFEEKMTLINI